jgi:hypothetical protein
MRYLLALLLPGWLGAQTLDRQVLHASGALPLANGTALSYSLGEPVTATAVSGQALLTQGFQQPDQLPVGTPRTPAAASALGLFPNPARTEAWAAVQGSALPTAAFLRVHDALGRAVVPPLRLQLGSGPLAHRIDVADWAAGTYLVSLCSASGTVLQTAALTVAK